MQSCLEMLKEYIHTFSLCHILFTSFSKDFFRSVMFTQKIRRKIYDDISMCTDKIHTFTHIYNHTHTDSLYTHTAQIHSTH